MPALLLGSIGVLAETSDLQRQSFNDAFAQAGLDWEWSRKDYAELLKSSGGQKRIEDEAKHRGQDVDAAALHAMKSTLFQERLDKGVDLRPGVAETIRDAREQGWKVAFVSGTSRENVDAILDATGLTRDRFDLITDASMEAEPKPSPALYRLALAHLDMEPQDALAVEDNPDGFAAAHGAEIDCIAFPGALHDKGSFAGARTIVDRLELKPIRAE